MPPNRLVNFFAFTLTSALQPALKLLLLPVFAAILGPDGMGRIAYIEAIILFVAVFSVVGVHHFYLRNYHHSDEQALFSTLTKFLVLYNLGVLVLCVAGAMLFDDRTQSAAFALASATNFLSVLLILPLRELRLQERALRYGATYAGVAVIQTLLALLLVSLGWGPLGWFIGHFFGILPFALYFAAKTVPRLQPKYDKGLLKSALKLGGALSMSALGMMTVGIADRIQLKEFVSYEQVGLYSVGYGLGIGVSVICAALYTTFEPALYRFSAVNDEFARGFSRAFALSYIVVTLAATGVIVLVEPVGTALLQPRFALALPVAKVVAICAIYGLCHLFITLVGIRLQSARALIVATFAAAVLNVLGNLVWIPAWGIMGAAYSTFGAYLALTLLYSPVIWRLPRLRALYTSALLVPVVILAAVLGTRGSAAWIVTLAPMVAAAGGIIWIANLGKLIPRFGDPSPDVGQ